MGDGEPSGRSVRGRGARLGTENRSCTECGRTGVGLSDCEGGCVAAGDAGRATGSTEAWGLAAGVVGFKGSDCAETGVLTGAWV